ncbi:uncharacterized protein [Nothobranchius furzeri]|uniref:Transcript variant X2 n=1 Tax=Nothobranchius furzeri TaxID=105023 RepID=A0A1A8AIB6_NOTFU|nr:transcript variant X2 [Nothobranchius furzeri]
MALTNENSAPCGSEHRKSPKSEPDPRPVAPPGRGTNKRKARGGGRGRRGRRGRTSTSQTSVRGMTEESVDGIGVEDVKPSQPILRPHHPPGTSTSSSQTRISGKKDESWKGTGVQDVGLPQPIVRPDPPPGTQTSICGVSAEFGRGHDHGGETETVSIQADISGMTNETQSGAGVQSIKLAKPIFSLYHLPGTKLLPTTNYTPIQIFQLFFTNTIIQKIIQNTNEFGATHRPKSMTPWTDVSLKEMFSFMALVIYMGLVKCCSITDYWRGGKLYELPFPKSVMTCKRFLQIRHALHLSSSTEEAANERKRGTQDYDSLCKIKPLYEELRVACKDNYHPSLNISIDERVVVTKSAMDQKRDMTMEPTYWGYKLFVLEDNPSGYKWDFFVCEGRSQKLRNGPSEVSFLQDYYKVLHKKQKWYKIFFFHFMDIAFVNAFVLYKEHTMRRGDVPFIQKEFREALALELAGAGSSITDESESVVPGKHLPVYISGNSSARRLRCRHCQAKTPIKCTTCKTALCFVPGRDCYNAWHISKGM